jgi:tetratricopeptide (TPR) repeat protein
MILRSTILNEYPQAFCRIAVLSLLLALSGCGAPTLEESLEDARASVASSDFATASIHVRNVLQLDSTHLEARLLLAEIGWRTGDLTTARQELERARDVDAPMEMYALMLARVYVETGEPQLALNLLDEAGPALESSADVTLVRSDAWLALGDFAAAERVLDSAEQAGAADAEVALRRARIAFARGNITGAGDAVEAALEADTNHVDALALRGHLAMRRGEYEQAIDDFRRAIDLHRAGQRYARTAPLLIAVVEAEISRGDHEAAGAAANELAALAPGSPLAAYAQGLVAFRAGRYEEAVTALRAAVTGAPNQVNFQSLLGAAQLAVGNLGQAEQLFLSILSRVRDDPTALQLLVETRLRQERPEAALEAFRSNPAAVDENNLAILTLRARTYLLLGDAASAIPSLERALRLSPGNQSVALQLVEASLALGDSEDAAEALRGAPDLSGNAELSANARELVATLRDEGADAAASYVQGLIAERPGAISQMTAAMFYQLTGDADAALAAVDAALAADGDLLQGHLVRGTLLQQRGNTDAAKSSFDQAIELAPESALALASRAVLAGAEQDYARAADLFERAYDASGNCIYLADRATALRQAGVPSWAEPLRDWLRANPEDVRGWMLLANQLRFSGENAAAVDAYERVIALEADNLGALNNAAWLASELGRDSAVDFARRAAAIAPDSGAVLDTLGWVLVRASQAGEGLEHLQRANQLLPGVAEIQYHLAVAQAQTGDVTAARQTLDGVLAGEVPAELRGEAERFRATL